MSVRPTSRQYLRCIPPHGISPHGRLNADRKSANRTRCVRRPAGRHNFGRKTEDAIQADSYRRKLQSPYGFTPGISSGITAVRTTGFGTSAPELRIRRLRPIRSKSHSGACAAVHSRPASEEAYGRRPFRIGTMATADRKIQTGLRDNRPSVRKRKDREHHPAVQINKLLINNE